MGHLLFTFGVCGKMCNIYIRCGDGAKVERFHYLDRKHFFSGCLCVGKTHLRLLCSSQSPFSMTLIDAMEFAMPSIMTTNQNKHIQSNLITCSIFEIFEIVFKFGHLISKPTFCISNFKPIPTQHKVIEGCHMSCKLSIKFQVQ